jgi:hypothetical protein
MELPPKKLHGGDALFGRPRQPILECGPPPPLLFKRRQGRDAA